MKKKLVVILLILVILLSGLGFFGYRYYKDSKLKPKIELIGDLEVTVKLGEEYVDSGAKSSFKDKDTSSDIIVSGEVDVNKVGSYEISYLIKNEKNKKEATVKRIVKVIDDIKPEIVLEGNQEVSLYVNDIYKEAGYKASDNYDGDLTDKVVVSGEVKVDTVGEYELVYTINDSSNNTSSVTRKVIVKEKPQPKPVTANTVNTSVRGLPVLMYHFFYDDAAGQTGNDNNWMAKSAFEEQMKYLSDNNYYFPSWSEVEDFIDGKIILPDKSVVITIDDGDITFIEHAIPIIEKYNVKATSFAVASWNGNWLPAVYGSSHLDFHSHSYDAHRAGGNGRGLLVNMTYEQALDDVSKSRDLINNSTIFCYPFGHYNDTVISALKDANYHLAFTTQGGRVFPGQNKYTLPRVRMSRGISLDAFKEKVR